MSENQKPVVGSITWADLTVPDADKVRDFYQSVVGWTTTDVDMGGYSDYCMNSPEDGATKAGVCHARGVNEELPPCWLVYITVGNLDASIGRCKELGGKVISGPKDLGPTGRFCIIQDPAGAYVALFQPAAE